ncbi:MAG TPA: helix-turn-helix transcriptional regulator [Pseudonocardiaceae bacterium]|nr:helix-turn-helix transcriptional regulator [Pseudonocardiaceae bacterium]
MPREFWGTVVMRAALADHDMGAVIRAYRTHGYHGRDIPQEVAASWGGITQARLSRIENGEPVNNLAKLVRWATALAVPADLLWFAMPQTGPSRLVAGPGIEQRMEAISSEVPWQSEMQTTGPMDSKVNGLDEMNRRDLLRLVSVAGTAMALVSAEGVDWDRLAGSAGARVDLATVEGYTALNEHLWHVFALSQSKAAMFPFVRQQFDVLTSSLQHPADAATHVRLCGLIADLLQLAGEILFDGNAYVEAAHCYTLAASAAHEAGAYDLWACAMTRHAFMEVYERRSEAAVAMLDLAAQLARRGDRELSTRQWVAVVQAQAVAGLGQIDACQRALDVAETVHGLTGQMHASGWLRFDETRLTEERGACYVELGRPDLACPALTDALNRAASPRRRGAILADLAVAGAQQRDVEQLVAYGSGAIELAKQTNSGYVTRKLAPLLPHLGSLADDPRVDHLSEQIPMMVGTN